MMYRYIKILHHRSGGGRQLFMEQEGGRERAVFNQSSTVHHINLYCVFFVRKMASTQVKASQSSETNDKKPSLLTSALAPLTDTVRMIPQFGQTCFARFTLSNAESHTIGPVMQDFRNTNTPATYVKDVMASIPVHSDLTSGIRCQKVTNGGKFMNRILTISNDRFALFVTHNKVKGSRLGNGVLSSMASKLPLPFVSRKGIRGFNSGDLRERYVRYVDVSDISFIHEGFPCTRKMEYSRSSNRLKGKKSHVDRNKEQIVSIVFRGNDSLDVLIEDVAQRQALVQTLKAMSQKYHESKFYVVDEARLLRYIWYDIDINQDGLVSESEFVSIVNRINMYVKNTRQLYQDYKKEGNVKGHLTYHQCMSLLQGIEEGKYDSRYSMQSLKLWDQIFGEVDYVSAEDFLVKFLHAQQKEMDATLFDVRRLLHAVNKMEVNRDELTLPVREEFISKTRFKNYLHHSFNAAFGPDHQELHRETMHRPLTEYWINTSHNTYLTGDQLQSLSSVECYAAALRRGCKCLELDCYNGEKDSLTSDPIPVVYHGGTFTSKLLFEDIVEVVKSYVESNPDTYPIILSLENHCSKPYQRVMADILRENLGTLLYAPFEGTKPARTSNEKAIMHVVPSPEALRGKVIIKGKRPPEADDGPDEADDVTIDNEIDPYEGEVLSAATRQDAKQTPTEVKKQEATSGTIPTKSLPEHEIVKELATLTLFHGIQFKDFKKSMDEPTSHMHSIGETKIGKILGKSANNSALWREYNATHMTRTYPSGARVDSSNYNPVLAWSLGCQLVALNFQTSDTPLILNDGRFRQNGHCGYVLKPPSVLGHGSVQRSEPVTVNIRVLSGCCLPKPGGSKTGETIDPYVKISMHDVQRKGGKDSSTVESEVTETINDNGFSPNWDESKFHKFQVHSPDVAMVHFSLMESDLGLDERISHSVVPLTCMRQGYRSILMHDKYGTRTGAFGFATLVVQIQIE